MTVELQSQHASTVPVVDALVSPQAKARLAYVNSVEARLAGASAIPNCSAPSSDLSDLRRALTLFKNGPAHTEFLCITTEQRPATFAAKSLAAHVLAPHLPDDGDLRLVDDLTTSITEQVASLWRLA